MNDKEKLEEARYIVSQLYNDLVRVESIPLMAYRIGRLHELLIRKEVEREEKGHWILDSNNTT